MRDVERTTGAASKPMAPLTTRHGRWEDCYIRRYAMMAKHFSDPCLAEIVLPSKRVADGRAETVPCHGAQARAIFIRLEAEMRWAMFLAAGSPFDVPTSKAGFPFSQHPPEDLLRHFETEFGRAA